jgi:hypothetical protein
MIFNLKTVDNLSQNIINSLKRFPMASLSAFLVTVIIVSLIELDYHYHGNSQIVTIANKIAFVASLGVVLFPALRLFWSNIIMTILGLALLIGYYYILPFDIKTLNTNLLFRHIILIIAIFLIFFWAPFINVRISNKNIWEWTQNLIMAVVATLFFSFLLYIGIVLALYSIEELFNIDIAGRRYSQLAVIIFGIYGVNLFLAQIPKYILLLQVRTYTKAEIIFTKYILTSLTIGYFIILFAYSAKILITMQWPSGVVAWISILFSIVAITTYLFWTPIWEKENIKFKRAIWVSILFQTVMLSISIWLRVEEYGITESRYFIALFSVWLFLMSLYFIFRKEASYKWLFVTLTILLIGSQFGQYSATNVSKNNQISRLQTMLNDNNFASKDADIKNRKNLYNTIEYLYSRHGIESLESVMPNIIKKYKKKEFFPAFAIKELGLGDIYSLNENRYRFFHTSKERKIVDIKGYNYLINFHYSKNLSYKNDTSINVEITKNSLNIKRDTKFIADINLTNFISVIDKNINNRYNSISPKEMEYSYTKDKLRVKILFNSIRISFDKNITNMDCQILLTY